VKVIWNLGLAAIFLVTAGVWPLSAAVFDRKQRKLPENNIDPDLVNWQLLEGRQNRAYNGVGLIKIRDFTSCTGFFIQTHHNPKAPAYVVTNAHCIDLLDNLMGADEILVNRTLPAPTRRVSVLTYTPNYFLRAERSRRTYGIKKILYATMKDSDMAVLELPTTQGELIRSGVSPLTIANSPRRVGTPIEVVGVPGEVLPSNLQYLHRSTCTLGPTVRVKEGSYLWSQALRNRCSVVGGMSGSPMIVSGQAIGVINTGGGYDRIDNLCSLNNPCEVGTNGRPVTTTNENYGQPLDKLPSCFTNQGIFSLAQPGCRLEKPKQS
jgi:V8-like Glu-specific endopeptidase